MRKQTRSFIPAAILACGFWQPVAASVAPPFSGGSTAVSTVQNHAVLRYSGPSGFIEYHWACPTSVPTGTISTGIFGPLTFLANTGGLSVPETSLVTTDYIFWTQAMTLTGSALTVDSSSALCTLTFSGGALPTTVLLRATLTGPTLQLQATVDQPYVKSFVFPTPVFSGARLIPIPYLDTAASYVPSMGLFCTSVLDWTYSHATRAVQSLMQGDYLALTDGSHVLMSERALYTFSPELENTFPSIPNTPSPYRAEMGGRPVFDVSAPNFSSVASQLNFLSRVGIRSGLVILHDWQFGGYDNELPQHFPAATNQGGDSALRAAIAEAHADGHRMALHENYVDYYPNYAQFSASAVALNSDGSPVHAWFNPATGIQSFGTHPRVMLSEGQTDATQIAARYGADAGYLDVNSASPPWSRIDLDARETDAGRYQTFINDSRLLWASERAAYHGPVLGEGASHWYYSGLLDGVEAQFGIGWTGNGPDAPLLVDFDLRRIHPLQINHGMGYFTRWSTAMAAGTLTDDELDAYRLQEVIFGHSPYIDDEEFWSTLPLIWREMHLVTPVSRRYATAQVRSIAYDVGGRWVSLSDAAKQNTFTQVQVTYDNGLQIFANNGPASASWNGYSVPKHGWVAIGSDIQAGTILKSGTTVDFVNAPEEIFAYVRGATFKQDVPRIDVTVKNFQQTSPTSFQFTYHDVSTLFNVDSNVAFVHFTTGTETTDAIQFQQDHRLAQSLLTWSPGSMDDGPYTLTVPAGASGDFDWFIGFLDASSNRISVGPDGDGGQRLLLGSLRIQNGVISLIPRTPSMLTTARAAVDVGPIRTNGTINLVRTGNTWTMQTLPSIPNTTLEFDSSQIPPPSQIHCGASTVSPVVQSGTWTLPTGLTCSSVQWTAQLPGTTAQPVSALAGLRVYPNPWRSDRGLPSQISFGNLTATSTVKVFTVSGHFVKSLPANGNSVARWDMTTSSGQRVASGIYLYVVTDTEGNKASGKLAVLR